ncbi:50S ribosomal protein L3 [archaeon]|nr:MAG: 50S ribosomal protein L3 [archaeon]
MGSSSGHKHKPRSGSLAYTPRKRAKSPLSRNTSFGQSDKVKLLGFPGYKAGMTHVLKLDDRPHAITKNKEIFVPVTVIETPPVVLCAIRGYESTRDGERVVSEVWAPEVSKDLERIMCVPKKKHDLEAFEKLISEGKVTSIRALVHTQPRVIKMKKRPELMEYAIGGSSLSEQFDYCKNNFGKELKVHDVFEDGNYIDVSAVSKGKGFQGPVKRWGVKIQSRKTNDARRHVGCIGPWNPSRTMWTVAMAGQMGFHQRTEFNKRVLRVYSLNEKDITPKGGFIHYGVLRSDYVLVRGSVPGPTKRVVRLRDSLRTPMHVPKGKPQITHVSMASAQGD